jgi:glycine cleavage system H protein
MNVRGFEFPDELFYLVEHDVWARAQDDGIATVGITALGIRLSGEIYMCRAKDPGITVEQGRAIAVVELAKAIVSVKSAVSGVVTEVNPALAQTPELVHLDPYGQGWIARVRLRDFAADRAQLLHGDAVRAAMDEHAWLNNVEHA